MVFLLQSLITTCQNLLASERPLEVTKSAILNLIQNNPVQPECASQDNLEF